MALSLATPTSAHAPVALPLWVATVRAHRLLVTIVAAYVLASVVVGPLMGWKPLARTIWQPVFFFANGAVLFGGFAAGRLVWRRLALDRARRGRLPAATAWRLAWRHARGAELADTVVTRVAVVYLLAGVTSLVFAAWKPVAATRGFGWDAPLIAWEAALHGGRQPWEWLQPVLGVPWVTRTIDVVYGRGWTTSQSLLLIVLALAPPSRWRTRSLATFLLAWIVLGSAAAVALSSAGPVYVERVHGLAEYAPLVTYLETVHQAAPLGAINTRDYLWAIYTGAGSGPWPGISAMPSMHIASTAVFAIALHHAPGVRPWVRWIGWGFLVIMLVGSVHLGWHYALDGYASILAVAGLWWAIGRLTRAAT